MSILNGLLDWTQRMFEPLGGWGLFILAFIESSFFPIPPDVLLIILSLADPSLALVYATIATFGSTLGGMFGYSIGYYLGQPILKKMFKQNNLDRVHNMFNKYEAWTIFIAGFTPIPYKIFTVTGGALYINFKKFVIASFFSRGLRFFSIATFVMLFGETVVNFIDQYFGLITIGVIVVAIIGYLVYRKLKSGKIDFFKGDF